MEHATAVVPTFGIQQLDRLVAHTGVVACHVQKAHHVTAVPVTRFAFTEAADHAYCWLDTYLDLQVHKTLLVCP